MDCLAALGQINHATIGGECAGIVTRVGSDCNSIKVGDRVAACCLDTFKTFVRSACEGVVVISNELTFVDAAFIPLTFVTAHYAICEVARMRNGESILIHSGAGGTGQAAIQISQLFDAEIFVTVGTEEKKNLLMERYNIPEDHIFYSRDTSFEKHIQRATQNRGVDIILNSLTEEGLRASWDCIANFGRFIEIGKKDIYAHTTLPMFPFSKNATFGAVDIASIPAMGRMDIIKKAWQAILKSVNAKRLRPAYPLQVYPISEVEKAFRYMQSGKNIGKMVVTIDSNDEVFVSSFFFLCDVN